MFTIPLMGTSTEIYMNSNQEMNSEIKNSIGLVLRFIHQTVTGKVKLAFVQNFVTIVQ